MILRPPISTLFPYTTLFRSDVILSDFSMPGFDGMAELAIARDVCPDTPFIFVSGTIGEEYAIRALKSGDRKSTRLNSSHANISYAVFCLKKNTMQNPESQRR